MEKYTTKEIWIAIKILLAEINAYIAFNFLRIRKFITGKGFNKVIGKFLDCSITFTFEE